MINVLIVANNLNPVDGGISTFIMNEFNFIDKSKIHLDFIVHMPQKKEIVEYFEDRGSSVWQISPFNPFKYRKFWKKFLKEHPDYDIIHVHSFDPTILYLGRARKMGITTMVHSHVTNMPKFDIVDRICRLNQFGSRFVADYFLGCSHRAIAERFGRKIAESPRSKFIPNGIDTEKFKFNNDFRVEKRKELNVSDDQIVIGQVGRFDYTKNHTLTLKVFKKFLESAPDSILVFIGYGGDYEDKVRKEIAELGIGKSVLLLGAKSDVYKYLPAFDMFMFPSIYEGLGIALIEAQCSGLPCFVSKDAIVGECDMGSGLLNRISLNDPPESWATRMKDSIPGIHTEDRGKYAQYVKEKDFDIHESAKVMERFYVEHAPNNHI